LPKTAKIDGFLVENEELLSLFCVLIVSARLNVIEIPELDENFA